MRGQRSNQLNYVPTRQINEEQNRLSLCLCVLHEELARPVSQGARLSPPWNQPHKIFNKRRNILTASPRTRKSVPLSTFDLRH
jgi:hypothetical protein